MLLALTRAAVNLLHPRMLWLMVWPVLLSIGAWLVLAIVFWGQALHWVDAQLQSFGVVRWMLDFAPLAFIAANLAGIILIIAFIPLVLVTAVIIIGVFAMPAMVEHVAQTTYPTLGKRQGGSIAGSLANTLIALAVFIALAFITLPLWIVPLLWPVIPVVLFAYLNQRVFRYDALAEHATDSELREVIRRNRGDLFVLGVVIAIIGHVPFVGFFVPVYGGLVFTHYCLQRLQALRSAPIEGQAIRL
jgi:CysZ protein